MLPARAPSAYSLGGYQIIFTILSADFGLNAASLGRGCFMIYRAVEFTVTAVADLKLPFPDAGGDRGHGEFDIPVDHEAAPPTQAAFLSLIHISEPTRPY